MAFSYWWLLLVLDNGSVFTKNLVDFLRTLGTDFRRIASDVLDVSQLAGFDSYILSGRIKNSAAMNALNSSIVRHAVSGGMPLLGICYGAEILALTLGGTIRRSAHVRGTETVEVLESNPLCSGGMSVFESHRFEISKLGGSMSGIGRSGSCDNELVRVGNSRIFGTQFHPEMSEDGQKLIRRFVML